MHNIETSIKSLYAINLLEGEGAGTAYEYYTKLRKLKKFLDSHQKPRKILIAGLPERYGLSMDFFMLGSALSAEIVAVDERPDKLKRAKDVVKILTAKKIIVDTKMDFISTDDIARFEKAVTVHGHFDLALSSEVLQRLNGDRAVYIACLRRLSTQFAIFAPNRGNESHAKLSGLRSVYLEELLKYCREEHSRVKICESGFLDMPPFPPGLSRSPDKRNEAAKSRFEALLMRALEVYSLCENVVPKFIKEKIAHIVYIVAKHG